ncbi:hypothetical protein [Corynebacterium sp. 335C]
MKRITALAAIPLLLLAAGCSGAGEPNAPEVPKAPQESNAPERAKPGDDGDAGESPESRESGRDEARSTATTSADDRPVGLTDGNFGEPTRINKTIARCAKQSDGVYEVGTTWFTDGTSGWTTYCADRFYDGPPPADTWEPEPTYEEPAYDDTAPAWDGPAPSHGDGDLPGDAAGGY